MSRRAFEPGPIEDFIRTKRKVFDYSRELLRSSL